MTKNFLNTSYINCETNLWSGIDKCLVAFYTFGPLASRLMKSKQTRWTYGCFKQNCIINQYGYLIVTTLVKWSSAHCNNF